LLFPSLPTTEEGAPYPRSTYGVNDGANDEKRATEAAKSGTDKC